MIKAVRVVAASLGLEDSAGLGQLLDAQATCQGIHPHDRALPSTDLFRKQRSDTHRNDHIALCRTLARIVRPKVRCFATALHADARGQEDTHDSCGTAREDRREICVTGKTMQNASSGRFSSSSFFLLSSLIKRGHQRRWGVRPQVPMLHALTRHAIQKGE